ncbi:MAG: dephospho-CoA kinase [Candidatus Omnitrophica bacterium]|nr:dephospho-CoA kinase [Candidatus Omnitrophota bacterium]
MPGQVIVVGVTGSFGTGKSTVAGYFKKLGAVVFDADKIAHGSMAPGTAVYKKILRRFGGCILDENDQINRRTLAAVVFGDRKALQKLNSIIHPYVIRKIKSAVARIKKGRPGATVVLDIPLLIEAGMLELVDKLIVVKTDRATQIQRCRRGHGLSRDEILARARAQLPLSEKIRSSDFVIDNSGKKSQTKGEVRKIWQEIQRQTMRKKRI